MPGQSTKLNVCQSVFFAKSPNLMSAQCTTPTVCVYNRDDGDEASWVTFIGSHSGLFFAIDVLSGDILWQVLLTDRIMSSAVLSAYGKYVIVG